VIVINCLNSGGAERHLLATLPHLDPDRFAISLLSLHPGGFLKQAFIARRVRVIDGSLGFIHCLVRFAKEVHRSRPIVHCFLPEAYLLGSSIGIAAGATATIMSRRNRNHYQSRHPVASCVERLMHRHVDVLLGNSRAVVQDLLSEGAPPHRVRLLYNGIEVDCFPTGHARMARRNALRAELGISDDMVVLTCVANLFPYKGHADLLDAFALLFPCSSEYTTLLLVGRDAGSRFALEAKVSRHGLSASVRFLGDREDVADLLAASDIGVLASHEEGFSNAVLEGMAASLPMVVTDVGGNAEAVIDGECGYVVPARNPAALALALGNLIGDADRRKAMGAAARRRVAAFFSLDICVAAYHALYEELWERRSHASHRP
jgi:glycosyltransferase involved in cell wall biosynthesis